MSLLKGLQHAQSCLGETRCSDREGHALAVQALAAAIAAAESAPAVVTAEEVLCIAPRTSYGRAEAIAALVAERTAAAVGDLREKLAIARAEASEAQRVARGARAEAREACAAYVQSRADAQAAMARDAIRLDEPRIAGTAENRAALLTDVAAHLLHGDDARGQSEEPAPAPAAGEDPERWLFTAIDAAWMEEGGRAARPSAWMTAAAHAIATRLRAREARVRALVEAARAYVMHTLTTGVVRCCVPKRDALCAAIDAVDALGEEG